MTINATYIRDAIQDLIEGDIGSIRTVTADYFEESIPPEQAIKGLALEKPQYYIRFTALEDDDSTPLPTMGSKRLGRLSIEIDFWWELQSDIDADKRNTQNETALLYGDIVIQALGYPGNLEEDASANTTGIISGHAQGLRWDLIEENWTTHLLLTRVSGYVLVDISQAVS